MAGSKMTLRAIFDEASEIEAGEKLVARFEAERQALAMMDHPGIAKVLDAGASETGRPFFVMELVRGIKITDYCDQNNFPTSARLQLFIQVCQAVQHAHQKGIADLKRHLDNEPVVARPPSSAYRFQKLVHRNLVTGRTTPRRSQL